MDHLDVVAGAIGTHVAAAGLSFDVCGDFRVDGGEKLPAFLGAAGHDGWTFQRALFPAGNTDAEVANTFCGEGFLAALSVGPERVTAVDDDVSSLEEGDELLDNGVNGGARLDHDLGLPWAFQ